MSRRRVRGIAIVIGIALCGLSLRWPRISSVATIMLLYVTFEYLLATRDNLDLTHENLDVLKNQLQRQQRVVLHFDLACRDKSLWLRVSNLGMSNFLLRNARFRKPDKTEAVHEIHRIVESGKTEETEMPDSLYKLDRSALSKHLRIEFPRGQRT